ncbi:MAG: cellulase family glycosylhydrolase [Cyclobacteriaceae bacterium]|nr:cellulase family glycosylhydrolase [Cyclobacteriaceae bacterium]
MKKFRLTIFLFVAATNLLAQPTEKWPLEKANAWYAKQPWFVGANFIPSTAINQLEMWQAETFDATTIDRELGFAESIGINCARVFLHDLVYQQDPKGLLQRMDTFLSIADKHKIKIMFVFFDSVWDPFPHVGQQRDPRPGVHNSGWVQSPGKHALMDEKQYPRLEQYVKAVTKRFANDKRIICWDIWNEPDNMNGDGYRSYEPENKVQLVTALMAKTFVWVRSQKPIQPLTSCLWDTESSTDKNVRELIEVQISNSDIISFHSYAAADGFSKLATKLSSHGRPLICTEFMARGNGSTFQAILPVAKKMNIGAMCWGLVDGKSNTIYDWDSWRKPNKEEPKVWHHDVFRKDGTPFSQEEIDLIKKMTGKNNLLKNYKNEN